MRSKTLLLLAFAALVCSPRLASADTVLLGTAGDFSVLAGSTVTNTGSSVIDGGSVGLSPGTSITGFPPGIVVPPYTLHAADAVALQAQTDLTTAYNTAAGLPVTLDLTGQDLGTLTLTPGVYFYSSSAQLTGTLTLDNQGDPDARFVFQIGNTLTTASGSSVVTINNGGPTSGCNVFWQVGSSATLGTTTAFEGHILALTSITLNTGATILRGSALARNGAVTLDTNTITNCTVAAPPVVVPPVVVPCVPGSLCVEAPITLYDAIAGSAASRFAGPTRDIATGDIDGDGYPDLLNLTATGVQIFHNDGTIGGDLHFTLTQEFAVDSGYRGAFIDLDGDGDLEFVVGDADFVFTGWNDGDGHFSVSTSYIHHWAVSATAMPFNSFTDPSHPGNRRRFVLAGTADMLAPTALGVPSLLPWVQVFDIGPSGAVTLVQTLAPIVADDVVATDLDGDGDVDLVISNRSASGADTIDIYESLAADTPGGLYVLAPPLDDTGLPFNFGYGVGVSEERSIAAGSWQRLDLWQIDPAFVPPFGRPLLDPANAWLPPVSVLADPLGLHGWITGEVLATGFGDLDCDGIDDLVFQGRNTPLVLVSLVGDPNLPSSRFVAPPAPGTPRDLIVLDWDRDVNGELDVVVGGSAGLFFYRNCNGGAAAPTVPAPPAPPSVPSDCNIDVYVSMLTLEDRISPAHVPLLLDPAARTDVAEALAKLHAIDPYYLLSGTLALPSPPLTQIQGIFAKLQSARALVVAALAEPGLDPAFAPALTDVANRLVAASACLADQAVALGGSVPKAAPGRRAARLRASARADLAAGSRLERAAIAAGDLRAFRRLGSRAIDRYARAFRRAAASWRLMHPDQD